jgi:hypothetical protein
MLEVRDILYYIIHARRWFQILQKIAKETGKGLSCMQQKTKCGEGECERYVHMCKVGALWTVLSRA